VCERCRDFAEQADPLAMRQGVSRLLKLRLGVPPRVLGPLALGQIEHEGNTLVLTFEATPWFSPSKLAAPTRTGTRLPSLRM
jgi:hypothetical protein